MAEATTDTPATLAQIKAACPDAPSDFVLLQLENGATVAQVQTAFIQWQNAKLREQQQDQPAGKGAGLKEGVPSGRRGGRQAAEDADAGAVTGDPVADFEAEVQAVMERKTFSGSRKNAVAIVCKKHPELHQEYVVATNSAANRSRIKTMFEDRNER